MVLNRPLRILHCIPTLGPGGADRFVSQLCAVQSESGHFVGLAVINKRVVLHDRIPEGVECFEFDYDCSLKNIPGMIRFLRSFRALLRKWRPDVLHCHLWPACRFATEAAPRNLITVWHIHDSREWLHGHAVRHRFLRGWTSNLARRRRPTFFSVSRDAAEATGTALRTQRGRFKVLPTAVDIRDFHVRQHEQCISPQIVATSHFQKGKGHTVLLKALRLLKERGLSFRAVFAGDGSDRPSVIQSAQEINLKDDVEFPGCLSDVISLLKESDVFVLPSVAMEGMPISVLEAMASGLPVVASDVGGLKQLVANGQTGFLCPPGDPQVLAEALATLVTSHEKRREMGLHGRRRVERYHRLQRVSAKMIETYRGKTGISAPDTDSIQRLQK